MLFKKKTPVNYLSLVPVRKVENFTDDNDIITLLIPKFKNEQFSHWFIPKRKSIYYKIHLDDLGSKVWRLIDNTRTVQDICNLLNEFLESKNKPSAHIEERVTKFLTNLYKNGFISFNEAQPQ